jgi:hypothetical protein
LLGDLTHINAALHDGYQFPDWDTAPVGADSGTIEAKGRGPNANTRPK